ncbi:MAG: type II toxin-antitoxin system Phd/YefM family antitoxin [Elusimicrobia bacterium]|nr:type II toxin-antitoxin system Phd/YefM family antitoxin [Elusimicrobiota bacterium]
MMTLQLQVLKKNGRKEFVVLPYKEFLRIQEALEDLEDIKTLRKEKKKLKRKKGISLDEAIKKLNL